MRTVGITDVRRSESAIGSVAPEILRTYSCSSAAASFSSGLAVGAITIAAAGTPRRASMGSAAQASRGSRSAQATAARRAVISSGERRAHALLLQQRVESRDVLRHHLVELAAAAAQPLLQERIDLVVGVGGFEIVAGDPVREI